MPWIMALKSMASCVLPSIPVPVVGRRETSVASVLWHMVQTATLPNGSAAEGGSGVRLEPWRLRFLWHRLHLATSTTARRAVSLVPVTRFAMVVFPTGMRSGVVVEALESGFGTPG